jgi:hypothetical protein
MAKRFTLAEAQSLIPEVSNLLGEAILRKGSYEEAERAIQASMQRIGMMGGMLVDRNRAIEERKQRDGSAGKLRSAIERIQAIGCVVKDLDVGLIDFPTEFRGQEVYLCWRRGESQIEFWHGIEEGFKDRKEIDQGFRDHHRGDPAQ